MLWRFGTPCFAKPTKAGPKLWLTLEKAKDTFLRLKKNQGAKRLVNQAKTTRQCGCEEQCVLFERLCYPRAPPWIARRRTSFGRACWRKPAPSWSRPLLFSWSVWVGEGVWKGEVETFQAASKIFNLDFLANLICVFCSNAFEEASGTPWPTKKWLENHGCLGAAMLVLLDSATKTRRLLPQLLSL